MATVFNNKFDLGGTKLPKECISNVLKGKIGEFIYFLVGKSVHRIRKDNFPRNELFSHSGIN
jgi:hypothetical protein